jgi:predicted  nucleic acid-binding Zn-ribbon protein
MNKHLSYLLFDKDEGSKSPNIKRMEFQSSQKTPNRIISNMQMTPNKNDVEFNTESIFESVQLKNGNLESYVRHNQQFQDPNFSIANDNASDFSVKNKINKICSSINSFNIIINSKQGKDATKFDQNLLYSYLNEENKHYLINYLLDIIIDLIWKIKEDAMERENILSKIQANVSKNEEYEKKMKKLNNELNECKKQLNFHLNKTNSEKDKKESMKKTIEAELSELRNENKKLQNFLTLYKNDMRKKETDISKMQEKMKKTVYSNSQINSAKNINFELSNTMNIDGVFNEHFIQLQNLYHNCTSYFSMEKLDILKKQNYVLFNLLKHFQNLISKFCQKTNSIVTEINFLNLIKIKDCMFSFHLLEENNLEEFQDNYLTNVLKFEEILFMLLDKLPTANGHQVTLQNNIENERLINNRRFTQQQSMHLINESLKMMPTGEDDILKNFKRWSLAGKSIMPLRKNSSIEENAYKNKWFEHIDDTRQLHYEYDENTVMK